MFDNELIMLDQDRLWVLPYPIRFLSETIFAHMSIIRLDDLSLLLHSPAPITPALLDWLSSVGEVKYIVMPNLAHTRYALEAKAAFANARLLGPKRLRSPKPVLDRILDDEYEMPLPGMLYHPIQGLPIIDEIAFYHQSSRTLILTDLLLLIRAKRFSLKGIVSQMLGIYDKASMSRTMKLLIRDQLSFKQSIDVIRQWPFEKIILAHEHCLVDQARHHFDQAFLWLYDF